MRLLLIFLFFISFSLNAKECNEGINEKPFSDVEFSHEYCSEIEFAKQLSWVRGYQDGSFKPNEKITRAEFVKILVEAIGKDIQTELIPVNCFTDVKSSDWYHDHVCFFKGLGVLSGYPDDSFRPHETILYIESLKASLEALGFSSSSTTSQKWWPKYVDIAKNNNYYLPSDIESLMTRGSAVRLIKEVYVFNAVTWQYAEIQTTSPLPVSAFVINFNIDASRDIREDKELGRVILVSLVGMFYLQDYIVDGFMDKVVSDLNNDAALALLTKKKSPDFDVLIALAKTYFINNKLSSTKGSISIAIGRTNGYLNGVVYVSGEERVYKYAGYFKLLDEEETNPCGCTLNEIKSLFDPIKVPNCHTSWVGKAGEWSDCPDECSPDLFDLFSNNSGFCEG